MGALVAVYDAEPAAPRARVRLEGRLEPALARRSRRRGGRSTSQG